MFSKESTRRSLNRSVCRFCLESNPDLLKPISTSLVNSNISTISTAIKRGLTILDIPYSLQDNYPNWMCESCSQILVSVSKFVRTVQNSKLYLEKQLMIQSYPELSDHLQAQQPPELLRDKNRCTIQLKAKELCTVVDEKFNPSTTQLHSDDEILPVLGSDVDEQEDCFEMPNYEHLEEECFEKPNNPSRRIVRLSIEGAEILPLDHKDDKKPHGKMCPLCGVRTTSLKVHIRTHTKIRPFTCEQCGRAFISSSKLKLHRSSAHSDERKFQCGDCGKTFALAKTLRTHQLSHTKDRKYGCKLCDKRFLFRWALIKHERTHTGEKPFFCNEEGCEKRFASSSNLRQHEHSHRDFAERKLACNLCDKVFVTKPSFRRHWKMHQEQEDLSL